MRRKISDYADVKYRPHGTRAHIVPFGGAEVALCGGRPLSFKDYWHGTGSMAEYEQALLLPLCQECEAAHVRHYG